MTQSDQSDRDILRAMLDRAGVIYRAVAYKDGTDGIIIAAKEGPKNGGYMGFEAHFEFNEPGELQEVQVWE